MRISDCSSDVCSSDLFRIRAKFRPRLPPVPCRAIPVVLLVGDKRPRAGVQQFLGCWLALADLIGEEREFLAVEAKATCCRQQFPVGPLVGVDALVWSEAHGVFSRAAPMRSGVSPIAAAYC